MVTAPAATVKASVARAMVFFIGGSVRQGAGDGVPRSVPNVAKLAWVHFTRHCQFAYSRYTSV